MTESQSTTEKPWLSRKEAAQYLESINCPVSPQTLANLAANGNARGPKFYKIMERRVRYKVEDLASWAKAQIKEC